MDTWLLLQALEASGERNRRLYLLKSRGMAHSNQMREFIFTHTGVQLRDVYLGPGGVLTGAARLAQEARDAAEAVERQQELDRRQRESASKKAVLAAQIAALEAQLATEQEELNRLTARERQRAATLAADTVLMAQARQADAAPDPLASSTAGIAP